MTFTLGRFTTSSGITFTEDGDRIDIDCFFIPTSDVVNTMKAGRIQLLGLSSGDVVPLTSSDHAELDGYYRVSGAVNVAPFDTMLQSGVFQFSASLERVANGFASPALEVVAVDAYRSTVSHNPGTSTLYAWFPSSYLWAEDLVVLSRTADSGAVTAFTPGDTPIPVSMSYGLAASDFYDGAATIEFLLGSTWWPAMGRQIPSGAVDSVRITNGIIRWTWRTDGDIEIDAYSGGSWGSAGSVGDFRFSTFSDSYASILLPTQRPTVLRNDVEQCALRFPVLDTTANESKYFDVSVRRGDISFVISANSYRATQWTFGTKATTAATAITASLRQTSNGAGGHRWVLMSPEAHSNNTADGRIYAAASSWSGVDTWGLGVEIAGTLAATPNTAAEVEDQFWHATGIRQRVISP